MSEDGTGRIVEPRQQRAIETRASLLAAVQHIVATDGIDAVTTTRVATETGVSVGTIYRYFIDREDLLAAAYDDTVADLIDRCASEVASIPDDTPLEDATRRLIGVYLAAAETHAAYAALLVNLRRQRAMDTVETANEERAISDIAGPFFSRFMAGAAPDRVRVRVLHTVMGILVDIYLTTQAADARQALRGEIEAHALFMIMRIAGDG